MSPASTSVLCNGVYMVIVMCNDNVVSDVALGIWSGLVPDER